MILSLHACDIAASKNGHIELSSRPVMQMSVWLIWSINCKNITNHSKGRVIRQFDWWWNVIISTVKTESTHCARRFARQYYCGLKTSTPSSLASQSHLSQHRLV